MFKKFKVCWKSAFLIGLPITLTVLGLAGYASKDAAKVLALKEAGIAGEKELIFTPKDKVTSLSRSERFNKKTGAKFEYHIVNGVKLAYSCLYMEYQNPNQEVMFIVGGLQGLDDPFAQMANLIADETNVCVIYPSGYGPSQGQRNSKDIIESVKATSEHLMTTKNWSYKNLRLVGYSAGALPVTNIAMEREIKSLYLYHPVVSWAHVASRMQNAQAADVTKTIFFQAFNYDGSYSLKWMLPRVKSPTKIVIAMQDDKVDPSDQFVAAELLRSAHPERTKVMVVQEDNHWSFSPKAVAETAMNF